MARPREHVARSGFPECIAVFPEPFDVACQSGWITGNVNDAVRGGLYDSLQTQWSAFLDSQDQMSHIADDPRIEGQKAYNDAAGEYNEAAASIPARWLAALWGCGEVELFA